MTISQANRLLTIATPLKDKNGEDELVPIGLSGNERLGGMFELKLELVSENHDIVFDKIGGQNVTVCLNLDADKIRYFNGFVSSFVQTDKRSDNLAHYQATVVPWLWFLTRSADCRIFQKKTVPDIIMDVFRDIGFTDFEDQLGEKGDYRTWEYCAQYRETNFNFVSRLMEQEGIYYYFKHENGKHTLVLANPDTVHKPYEGYEEIEYHVEEEGMSSGEYIQHWQVQSTVQPGVYALNDFDFTSPKKDLKANSKVKREHALSDYEIYDYPGEYVENKEAQTYAKIRIEELQSQYEVAQAHSNVLGIRAGCTFKLDKYFREEQNKEYLITSVNYQVSEPADYAGEKTELDYSCSFNAIDVKQPFRTPRITTKPSIQGPQTAMVVGPKNEEIHTDEYGRVKVQFHWDRYGKADENSSCWIRVAQLWAGNGWGAMFLPRVGQEVIVEFLEGDPDRPIITGRVYNEDAMPHYELPEHKTKSYIKSNSSPDGGGFNEIRFEDKKGEEQVFIHAEKNLDIRVKNDRFETILNNRHLVVEKNKSEHVKNNRSETIGSDHKEKIGKDRNLKVVGKEAKAVDGSLSLAVGGDVAEVFKANHSEETTNDYYLKADNITIEGLTNVTIKVGDSFIAIESGGIKIGTTGDIALEADGNINQEAGGDVKLDAKGNIDQKALGDVSVEGTGSASIKGTGGLTLESPATTDLKGSMTTVSGDAMTTVKGGVVMIN